MAKLLSVLSLIACCAVFVTCGPLQLNNSSGPNNNGSNGDGGTPTHPIVATHNTWTWVDFSNTTCDDGSPTGLAINPSTSANLVIFMQGGGECWDANTCDVLNTAAHGPYGSAQFNSQVSSLSNTILDRGLAGNPFADWNYIYVPYCTGDLHSGNNTAIYQVLGVDKPYQHAGHANFNAFLSRVLDTFPHAPKIAVMGASAGGYGTLLNYQTVRTAFPAAQMYLIDDSGPMLEGAAMPPAMTNLWWQNWKMGEVVTPLCANDCDLDLSVMYTKLAAKYPSDRMALLSSLQDQTIRAYMLMTPQAFETELRRVAMDRLDLTSTFKRFFVPGETHVMLGNPTGFSQNGVALLPWLTQMVQDDSAWATQAPL